MEQEELTAAFKQALTDFHGEQAGDANRDFFIPREEHYNHHSFIGSFMELVGLTKKTLLRAAITIVVGGLATVIILGTAAALILKAKGLIQ